MQSSNVVFNSCNLRFVRKNFMKTHYCNYGPPSISDHRPLLPRRSGFWRDEHGLCQVRLSLLRELRGPPWAAKGPAQPTLSPSQRLLCPRRPDRKKEGKKADWLRLLWGHFLFLFRCVTSFTFALMASPIQSAVPIHSSLIRPKYKLSKLIPNCNLDFDSIFKGQCAFADQVQRKGCSGEEFFQFTCPATARGAHEHPRYPDETGKKYQNDAVVNNLTQHKLFGVDDWHFWCIWSN